MLRNQNTANEQATKLFTTNNKHIVQKTETHQGMPFSYHNKNAPLKIAQQKYSLINTNVIKKIKQWESLFMHSVPRQSYIKEL